jgi:quercetin dioxygenase-like cupin family protein
MPVLRQILGKLPSGRNSRVRNFIANRALGTERCDIHENVINPGVTIPWHFHATEEVIVVLEGEGECRTDAGCDAYRAGDVIILPARTKHSLRNSGPAPIRQLCFFPDDPGTQFLEAEYPGQMVEVFNAD